MPTTSPVVVYLSLGSNLGDRAANLRRAVDAVAALSDTAVERLSDVYETRPWGPVSQPDFLNLAAAISTTLGPEQLLRGLQAIETALGRVRKVRWGPRTIDIDILLYGETHLASPELTLPHPRMLERAFVLVPLAEIAPDLMVAGRSVADHLRSLGDVSGQVRRLGPLRGQS